MILFQLRLCQLDIFALNEYCIALYLVMNGYMHYEL